MKVSCLSITIHQPEYLIVGTECALVENVSLNDIIALMRYSPI